MNYMFMNDGDLCFFNELEMVGMMEKMFSQGVVYVDLDNDGDFDLLVNNMNDCVFLYENYVMEKLNNYYLSVKLKGNIKINFLVYGVKVWVFIGDNIQL